MIKKMLAWLLIGLLTTLLVLMLGGCQNETEPPASESIPPDGTDEDTEPDSGNAQSDTISIVENGTTEYRIVVSDFASEAEKKQATALRKAIEAVSGVKPAIVSDWEDKDENTDIKEILVGKTNRTVSSELVKALGDKEFGIVVSGNKIAIAGGTNEQLARAIAYFLATYAGYHSEEDYMMNSTITIPKNLNFIQSFDVTQNVVLYVTNEELSYVDALYDALKHEVAVLDRKCLADDASAVFDVSKYGIVIVAGIEKMTAASKAAIDSYMKNGGRILTLGGPAFESTLYELDGEWYERYDYITTALDSLDDENMQLLIDTSSTSVTSKLKYGSSASDSGYTLRVGDYGLEGSDRQLYHEVNNLQSWDLATYVFTNKIEIVNGEQAAICFWARAMDDHTSSIYFEVTDEGGSRWIATANLSEEWDFHILTPADFQWWHDSKTPAGDFPNFNRLQNMKFGFATSGQSITKGHHSYAISDIMLASSLQILPDTLLEVDSLSPIYELYPITNAASLVASENQVFVAERNYQLSDDIVSCFPGRQGLGYSNGRTSRFVPLIEVKDEKGLHSGYAAWMHIFSSTTTANGDKEGSMLACFSSVSEEFYNADGIAAIVDTVKVMLRNVFLVEGGTDEFTYVEKDTDKVIAGLSFVDLSRGKTVGLVASVELYKGNTSLASFSSDTLALKGTRNHISQIYGAYDLSGGKPDRAIATLILDGKVIDRIEHEISFWATRSNPSFVYIEDGHFKKDGRIISFFGVNYMPSYGIAEPNFTYFDNYTMRAAYDPTVIANDLDRIVNLGMNSVSVFVHYANAIDNNNMLDLIEQCAKRGLYVNLSIRDVCYPLMNYDPAKTEELIHHQHFHENDNVYALDIEWEPRIGSYDDERYIGRKDYDAAWAAWIDVQYGSLAVAEQSWGVTLTKTSEGHPYVSDAMLDDTTGRYLKVISAYYRFLDDHIAAVMNRGITHIRSLAPEQLITFRMNMSGSGLRTSSFYPSMSCFDFQSLVSTLDYMEPEGYQLSKSGTATQEQKSLQIPIANAYARYVQPGSPIVWKEFGMDAWSKTNNGNFNTVTSAMQAVAEYYSYTLEYALNSYTSGMYAWYFAGGYRLYENSDFGIINPDGSDRPVTALLREYAPKFINQGERPEAEVLIEVERDNMVGGMFGIYDQAKVEACKAYNAGKFFEFVDANMDEAYELPYADEVYEAAVADAKSENGTYPLRYVNGMVKDFKVVTEGGKTYAEVTVCNTKQSTWRAGTVSLVSYDGSDIAIDYTIEQEIGYLENATVKFEISGKGDVALRFEIEGVQFGPLYTTTVK